MTVTDLRVFADRFSETARRLGSALCVGLDPDTTILCSGTEVVEFNKMVVEATAEVAVAYKPNLAIYESIQSDGLWALEETISYIRDASPDALIIADAKRGDIGPCAVAYGERFHKQLDFDAVTAHPYMGYDSIEHFASRRDKGVFVLCRTSNESACDFQDLTVIDEVTGERKPLYLCVAETARNWNARGNVGLVVGATYPDEIRMVREACEDMFFLIPGAGYQGGDVGRAAAAAADKDGGGFTISSSRQIMYAAMDGERNLRPSLEGSARIRKAALKLRDEINSALP